MASPPCDQAEYRNEAPKTSRAGDAIPGGKDGDVMGQESSDATVRELLALRAGLEHTIRELTTAAERADELIGLRRDGCSWLEIVAREEHPLIIETLTRVLHELGNLGARLRREEALAMQREGVTITRIAKLFGISRQRASILLQELAGRPESVG
jgi:hypothetical protein